MLSSTEYIILIFIVLAALLSALILTYSYKNTPPSYSSFHKFFYGTNNLNYSNNDIYINSNNNLNKINNNQQRNEKLNNKIFYKDNLPLY